MIQKNSLSSHGCNFQFNFFTSEMPPWLQEDHPELPSDEISQINLEIWMNLPSHEKQHYNDMELKDNIRFK
jgi:hypothetical protein